jgi:hypothetical protein
VQLHLVTFLDISAVSGQLASFLGLSACRVSYGYLELFVETLSLDVCLCCLHWLKTERGLSVSSSLSVLVVSVLRRPAASSLTTRLLTG